MIEYRDMVEADVEDLRPILRTFVAESKMLEIFQARLNLTHFVASVEQMFELGMAGGVVAEDENHIVGAILYTVTPNIFSGESTAQEVIWYVLPEHREGSVGARLYNRAMTQVIDRGCVYMAMIHLATSMPEALKDFYLKQGYTHMESNYQKRL